MPIELEKVRIGDLGKVVTGKTPPTAREEYFGIDYPFITPTDIDGNQRHIETERYLSEESKKDFKNYLLPTGAICFVCIGATIGKICVTKVPSFTNQQINSIIVNGKRYDNCFVYYLLSTKKEHIKSIAGGAATPIVSKSVFSDVFVEVPKLIIQQKVAAILSAYDELIENNLRRIKILEEMGQTIYREWFVKFRFPGHQNIKMVDSPLGKIPEGWEVSALGSLCTLIKEPYREEPHFSFPLIDLARIPQKTLLASEVGSPKELSTSRIIFSPDDVLFGAIRPYLHKVILAPTNGVTNVSVFVLRSREEINKPFVAVLLSMEDSVRWADQYSTGTKMPVIKWDVFQQMKVLIPKKEVIRGFYDVVWPMMQLIKNTFLRNSNLRQTRDFLLPKLISGELDVSELDIKIAETERN